MTSWWEDHHQTNKGLITKSPGVLDWQLCDGNIVCYVTMAYSLLLRYKVFLLALVISSFPTMAQRKVTALFHLDTATSSTVGFLSPSNTRRQMKPRQRSQLTGLCVCVCVCVCVYACVCLTTFMLNWDKTRQLSEFSFKRFSTSARHDAY